MKGIAKHSAEYMDATGLKRWHTLELEFDQSTKHPLDALSEVETLVQQAVSKSISQVILDNSNPYTSAIGSNSYGSLIPPIIAIERTSEDERIAELIRDIYACTEINGNNGLLTYNKLASTCKEAQQAFDIMFRKLNNA
jgi:hypothetical protein